MTVKDLERLYDYSYWAKFERILLHARELGIIVQVVFFTDAQEAQNYPFNDLPEAELRYYDYALARLGALSNVEWCVTNEWALFKPNEWVEEIGQYLADHDPYDHILSVHGHGHFPFKHSSWCTHDIYHKHKLILNLVNLNLVCFHLIDYLKGQ